MFAGNIELHHGPFKTCQSQKRIEQNERPLPRSMLRSCNAGAVAQCRHRGEGRLGGEGRPRLQKTYRRAALPAGNLAGKKGWVALVFFFLLILNNA